MSKRTIFIMMFLFLTAVGITAVNASPSAAETPPDQVLYMPIYPTGEIDRIMENGEQFTLKCTDSPGYFLAIYQNEILVVGCGEPPAGINAEVFYP